MYVHVFIYVNGCSFVRSFFQINVRLINYLNKYALIYIFICLFLQINGCFSDVTSNARFHGHVPPSKMC